MDDFPAARPRAPRAVPPESTAARLSRAEAWVTGGLVVAAMLALAYHCGYLAVPIVDDAAISLAYGITFFSGEGFRVTPASQPVEGFSNLLWTLLLGASRPLRLSPEPYAHGLGILFGLLALPLFALWGPASTGRRPRWEDALAPWVAALNPTYAYWISSGMETGLQTFLLGLSGFFLLRELRTGRSAHVGWALGLLCLTRPEGALFTVAAGLVWVVQRAVRRRWPGRQEAWIAGWLVLLVGGWMLVRWAYFADFVPNTYYAKRLWDFNAKGYLTGFFETYGRLWQLAAAGLVLGLAGGAAGARRGALVALFLACGVFFAWNSKGDWMREWRFLAPLVPLLGAAMAVGVSGVRRAAAELTTRGWKLPARGAVAVVSVAMVVLLAPALRDAMARAPGIKENPELPYSFIAGLFQPVRERTEALKQLRPLVAYPDLGGQAMVLRDAEIIDVAGLADYALAHHAGNDAAMEDYLLSEGPPILVDAHGPSGHVGHFRQLMGRYRNVGGPVWQLQGLSATEDPRCPGGKAAVLALDAKALTERFEADIREGRAEEGLRRWRCVFAYKPDAELPDETTRERLANDAQERGEALEREGKLQPALRHYSLATLLDDGNAHRRRKTEKLREKLFPRPAQKG
ncbi:hypothetical protein P2318_04635 [Myxococcaceae bacterium GXIMD 01537]